MVTPPTTTVSVPRRRGAPFICTCCALAVVTAAQMTFAKPTTVVIPELPPEIRSAHRSGKRLRHVRLLGEARLHQEHHRIGLGDRILGTIVMHRQSGDDDHPLTRGDPQAAARIDDHGVRRRRQGQRQGLLGAHAQG